MAIQTAVSLHREFDNEVTLAQFFTNRIPFHTLEDQGIHRLALHEDMGISREFLLEREFEVIHLFDFVDQAYIRLARQLAKELGIPLFVTPATHISLWENADECLAICNQAERIFVLTKTERDDLAFRMNLPQERFGIIPHAPYLMDTEPLLNFRRQYAISNDAPMVLFLSRKLKSKGYELILRASMNIIAKHPETIFVFIGPEGEGSVEVFASYHNEEHILNLDMVDERVKFAALCACQMLILPSTVDVFPLVFLEAWACGKPVIASMFNGVDELIHPDIDGLIVEPTAAAVELGILRLIEQPDLARRLGQKGRQRIDESHNWGAVAAYHHSQYVKTLTTEEI